MKKIFLLFALFAILFFTACDGEIEQGKELENPSLGADIAQEDEADESSGSETDVLAAPGTFAYEFPDALCRKKILGLLNDQDGGKRIDSSEITAQDFSFMASLEKLDLARFTGFMAAVDESDRTLYGQKSAAIRGNVNINGETIRDVYGKDRGIASLKGIEHFTALQELNCSGNQLTELDLSNNTALIKLYCSDNKLAELDLSKNPALEVLLGNRNYLEKLYLANNIELRKLELDSNRLTELDLSKNTMLRVLQCYSNKLAGLDLSNNIVLEKLDCTLNYLKSPDDVIGLREGAIFYFDPQF
ncbi:MAG: hypothetical protein FWF85_09410 [Clostridiales bacterium]|nr:hypothetical protein [Clostridiales bacterium]